MNLVDAVRNRAAQKMQPPLDIPSQVASGSQGLPKCAILNERWSAAILSWSA